MPEVTLEESRRFMEDCLVAAGTPVAEAKKHADLLMHADIVGHYSHGLNRLEYYINDIVTGTCIPTATPEILKEKGGTAWVDGGYALGATIGNFCMDLAIKKAKEFGVSWITAKHCNHYGMAGYWALKAEREGLIGLSSTNSSPIMVPTRAKKAALGTNPIGMAAPAANGDKLIIDMATTACAMGKIDMKVHKNEPLPMGWALGANGHPTTDAKEALKTALLMPLGGEEKTSGHKGYCLATMMETFCSLLSDSNPSYKSRRWILADVKTPLNFGQLYAVIDPSCFAPGFGERLAEFLNMLRNLEPADPMSPVMAPGDQKEVRAKATISKGTITYPQKLMESVEKLAKQLSVKQLQISKN